MGTRVDRPDHCEYVAKTVTRCRKKEMIRNAAPGSPAVFSAPVFRTLQNISVASQPGDEDVEPSSFVTVISSAWNHGTP